jgi:hypothetical protein
VTRIRPDGESACLTECSESKRLAGVSGFVYSHRLKYLVSAQESSHARFMTVAPRARRIASRIENIPSRSHESCFLDIAGGTVGDRHRSPNDDRQNAELLIWPYPVAFPFRAGAPSRRHGRWGQRKRRSSDPGCGIAAGGRRGLREFSASCLAECLVIDRACRTSSGTIRKGVCIRAESGASKKPYIIFLRMDRK